MNWRYYKSSKTYIQPLFKKKIIIKHTINILLRDLMVSQRKKVRVVIEHIRDILTQ